MGAAKSHRVCPWWLGYFLISPLRRWLFKPLKFLAPYVREGMTILEPGPGMGFFTLELARLAGPEGRVIAIDIQPKMLDRLRRRAQRAGLAERIDARLASGDSLELDLTKLADFALAFAVVHELPSAAKFFCEMRHALKSGARLLFAEPAGHVAPSDFQEELDAATRAGFRIVGRPRIRGSLSALLEAVNA